MDKNIPIRKNWFTLIEIVMGMLVIGVWLIAVITILQYATKLTNTTKSQIVAINLAREWLESVYNIRDTNRKMFASKKDQCRLASEPKAGVTDCETIPRITEAGLKTKYTYIARMNESDPYFLSWAVVLKAVDKILDVKNSNGVEPAWPQHMLYRMCLAGDTRDQCANFITGMNTDTPIFETRYWRFWRGIEIKWLFDKKDASVPWGTELTCADWEWAWCGDSNAKELRFCSKVDYIFDAVRDIELCSTMTNFLE